LRQQSEREERTSGTQSLENSHPRCSITLKPRPMQFAGLIDKIEESIKNDTFKDILKADSTSLEE